MNICLAVVYMIMIYRFGDGIEYDQIIYLTCCYLK